MPRYNPADPRPPHTQISDALRARMDNDELTPGDKLPTQTDVATEWGVARDTVQAALKTLRGEGRISSRQGSGAYVRTPPMRVRHSYEREQEEKDLALADLETRRGRGTSEADMGVGIDELIFEPVFTSIEANDKLVDLFQLDKDRRVLQREYTTQDPHTGLRTSWSRSWLPIWLIESNPELLDAGNEPWPGGTPHALSTIGIELDQHIHSVTASPSTPEDQRLWGLDEGIALLRVTNYAYAVDGAMVMISEVVHPADRTELVFRTQLERW